MVLTCVLTRSRKQEIVASMGEISDSVKNYLSSIINTSSDDLKAEIARLRESVELKNDQIAELHTTTAGLKLAVEELKVSVEQKNVRITELNHKIVNVVRRNVVLSSKIAESHESLAISIDDLQQYGRKNSLRVEGIEVSDTETNAALAEKVEKARNSIGAKVTKNDFFRLHRSSKPRTLKYGKVVGQCIVRFNS